jgi:hypothetical protein
MGKRGKEFGKRGLTWETLIPWIIAISVLVLVGVLTLLMRERLGEMGSYIKGLFGG